MVLVITIFCGEDSVAARAAYIKTINSYKEKQLEILSLPSSSILDIKKGLANNLSLFSSQKVFCIENLEKYSFKKSTKATKNDVYEALVSIASDKSIILLDFEDEKQARELKLKDLATVHESKPAISIFKLMDECIPLNKEQFIKSLRAVCETQDEMFVFIMFTRYVRNLVLALAEAQAAKLPPWQRFKIIGQARKWDKQKLTNFYSGLIKIEINAKTSADPYGIRKSLEILACHYL